MSERDKNKARHILTNALDNLTRARLMVSMSQFTMMRRLSRQAMQGLNVLLEEAPTVTPEQAYDLAMQECFPHGKRLTAALKALLRALDERRTKDIVTMTAIAQLNELTAAVEDFDSFLISYERGTRQMPVPAGVN